uniref:Uncharacterized protein n=1 Tax=Tetraselmis sp. GSL018 TaxID=582737 RepID=A0A061S511_9CHLO|mmetsp:Transcript_38820/g.91913  ORF Transcript_38820/g.91913 Transcript_38820/m.91913 type:complete len:165 (+) Transcript_38820:295-789(+)|eukprot:CAMPEP_0177604410 /NCGR_PEP_ID=MMETSP0419_2-20121207/16101_1 /TAXON_ID=582737 /ORGANISM="Tetraselmis sp., Strain GSL018" /LENGTH=164 /DNA_ID=CAMNT_0019098387 /DNA_START=245 /DNA_END=739 /DNA_ORIENTATION=-
MGKSARSNRLKRNKAVRRARLEESEVTKERMAAKQLALAKSIAAPKISENPDYQQQLQRDTAMSLDEDRSSRAGQPEKMEVDAAEKSLLKPQGGVRKKAGRKVKLQQQNKAVDAPGRKRQGEEKYRKLQEVNPLAGTNPAQFTRLRKRYKKGRTLGIRKQLGIE